MTKKPAAPKITEKVAVLLRERQERLAFVSNGEVALEGCRIRIALVEEILTTMEIPLDTPVPPAEPANRAEMRSQQRDLAKQHKKATKKAPAKKVAPAKKRAPRAR